MPKKKLLTTKMIVTLALLLSMSVVLDRILGIQLANLRISFGNLPIILAGLLFGPIAGGIVGLLSDGLGFLIRPTGEYIPFLMLTPILMGVLPPLIGKMMKKRSNLLIFIALILPAEILGPYLWTNFCLYISYGMPFIPNLIARAPAKALIAVVDIIMTFLLYKSGAFRALGLDRFGGKKDELRGNAAVHPQR
jgi:ECF transporter S component (folate family)